MKRLQETEKPLKGLREQNNNTEIQKSRGNMHSPGLSSSRGMRFPEWKAEAAAENDKKAHKMPVLPEKHNIIHEL